MPTKMLKSLSILSYKGGVGKTSIAINLAVCLANKGHKVCLLENDFQGPSLNTWWKPESSWLNQYLQGKASIDDCMQELSSTLNLSGKLFVGFADPTPESIQISLLIDQQSSMKMLQNLMRAKRVLSEEPYEIDYLITDCSPGIGFSAVNAMLVADSALFIVKLSNADIIGTSQMIKGLYKQLKKRTFVLANLIPKEVVSNEKTKLEAQNLVERSLMQHVGDSSYTAEFLAWIPNDESLITYEFEQALKTLSGEEASRIIYTLDKPDHIFSTTLEKLIPVLFNEV